MSHTRMTTLAYYFWSYLPFLCLNLISCLCSVIRIPYGIFWCCWYKCRTGWDDMLRSRMTTVAGFRGGWVHLLVFFFFVFFFQKTFSSCQFPFWCFPTEMRLNYLTLKCLIFTLKAPRKTASENVICWIFLQTSQSYFLHTGKQCGPRSDCSWRSSLIWVHTVCRNDF